MTFPSVYEMTNPLTTVRPQHFWDWFSGDSLNSRWRENNITHTGIFAMADEVDGGFSIKTSATSGSRQSIGFGNIRPYAHDGSVCIFVFKRTTDTSFSGYTGLKYDDSNSSLLDSAVISQSTSFTNIGLYTGDASAASNTQGSTPRDTAYHSHKIECGSANIIATLDGVTDVTKTTNRPTKAIQPYFLSAVDTATANDIRVRYCEAYNT
mgnify:FL=1|tara:strand:+ start:214 stop:840 length:627 start_codon:yes stop_codon:yes gene_type:complete